MTLTITMIGTLSSIPQTPQSQPQNNSETKTAVGFILAIRPVIQVVTKVPTKVAIARDAPLTSRAVAKRIKLHEGSHCRGAGGDCRTDVGNDVQQAGDDGPRAGILQADPSERDPAEQADQHVRGQQHEHVLLDRAVDVVEYAYGNFPSRQRRPRQSDQLAPEGIAAEQQEDDQEHDHQRLSERSDGAQRTLPQEIAQPEFRLIHI